MSEPVLRVGARLRSTVCTTEVIVVKAPADGVVLECGGQPMVPAGAAAAAEATGPVPPGPGTAVGKRYALDETGLELLCVKAGAGTLSVAGRPVEVRAAKLLPSSD